MVTQYFQFVKNKYAIYYVKTLISEFNFRKSKNPKYSMRAYARDLGFNVSHLSEILSGKKGISERNARAVANLLALDEAAKKVFLLSVAAAHSRSIDLQKNAIRELRLLNFHEQTYVVEEEKLRYVNHWRFYAILELITFSEFNQSIPWLAEKLCVNLEQVQNDLETLTQIGWIEIKDGKIFPTFAQSMTSNDIPSEAIRSYHVSVLRRAEEVLPHQSLDKREIQSVLMPIALKHLPKAKEDIRKFVLNFSSKYSVEENKESVYQLSIQFFDLLDGGKT